VSVESWLLLLALLAATVLVVVAAVLVRSYRPLRWRLVGVPGCRRWRCSPSLPVAGAGVTRLATSEGSSARWLGAHAGARGAGEIAEAETPAARYDASNQERAAKGRRADLICWRRPRQPSIAIACWRSRDLVAGASPRFRVARRALAHRPPADRARAPPDSTWVAVGTRRWVQALTADATRPHRRAAGAERAISVVQGMQQAQRLGFLEELKLSTAGRLLAAIAAVLVLVAVTLGVLLARTLTRPIERLRRAFESVAAGDLGHQVALGAARDGELSRLLRGFNDMSRELDESKQQLVRTARLAAWQDVARRLAHEIKNPLTPITLSIHRCAVAPRRTIP
jgi:HAMP domain-containing protein